MLEWQIFLADGEGVIIVMESGCLLHTYFNQFFKKTPKLPETYPAHTHAFGSGACQGLQDACFTKNCGLNCGRSLPNKACAFSWLPKQCGLSPSLPPRPACIVDMIEFLRAVFFFKGSGEESATER